MTQPFAGEEISELRQTGRDLRMPQHSFAIAFWPGNELKVKRDTITNRRECKQGSAAATRVARHLGYSGASL